VCTSSTPTEYGSASPASAPADDVSAGSNNVIGDCVDVGDVKISRDTVLLPVTEHEVKKTLMSLYRRKCGNYTTNKITRKTTISINKWSEHNKF